MKKARQTLHQSRIRSKRSFETKYAPRLQKKNYEPGALVLLRNVPIENTMSIERKTTHRYMGPYSVVRQTQGGSYVLQELNGNILRHTVAAFRLVPYIMRKDLTQIRPEIDSENDSDRTKTDSERSNNTSDQSSHSETNTNVSDK